MTGFRHLKHFSEKWTPAFRRKCDQTNESGAHSGSTEPGCARQRAATAGFTLIELLVVLAILALVASIGFPYLTRSPSDRVRLDATARQLAAALRVSRAAAVLRNGEIALLVDAQSHSFESAAVPHRSFDSDIAIALKIAEPERVTPSRGGIRFFPDGSTTGGDVTLTLGGLQAKICVNWLTGETRQGQEC
jgi:general secretion pathway protein H